MSGASVRKPKGVLPGLGRHVLVVDDDPIQGKLALALLEASGFAVGLARGAAEAVEMVRERLPDAILSDVLMDHLDGFSLCEILRRDPKLADVPIVLTSSFFRDREDEVLARKVGANALVERSPQMEKAIATIVEGLVGKAPVNETANLPADLHASRLTHQLRRMQQTAAAADIRWRTMFEQANDAISVQTPEGILLDVNRQWEEITQRSREHLIGLRMADIIPAHRDADGSRRVVDRDTGRGEPVPIRRADGTTRYIDFTSTKIEIDGEARVFVVGRDITEIVEANRRLAESERRYRSVVDNVPDVLWSASKDLRVTFMTPNVSRICGFAAEEFCGGGVGPAFSRIHPDDVEAVRVAALDTLRTGVALDEEFRWRHADGRWVWIHTRAVRVTGPDGEKSLDGIFSDVTSRKLLEEQLVHAQKIESIAQLTAGIAHDFNNVLAAISANTELLMDGMPEGELREITMDIKAAARRGVDFTSRLIAFSRRETEPSTVADVGAIVNDMEAMLSRVLGHRIRTSIRTAPNTPTIKASGSEISQVLMNLVVNARDAMPNGGELTITTRAIDLPKGPSNVGRLEGGRYVVLSVKDTGVGMSATAKARLFEPFFTTKDGTGTGLGLSTTYGIIRRSGGHISVESEPGAGTTFTLYFPCQVDTLLAPPVAIPVTRTFSSARPLLTRAQTRRISIHDQLRGDLETVVRRRTAELEVANRELEAFSYSVSHDLCAPIRAIQGSAQAALDDGGANLDESVRKHLRRVKNTAERMKDLTEALLDLSHVSRAQLSREKVDVTALASQIGAELVERESSRRVELVVEPNLATEADPRLFRVLLANLLSNAWKFTARTNSAKVEVGRAESGEFFVQDNGEGFDMRLLPRLFTPFQRIAAEGEAGGTGIGLATVKRIIHRHGGDIRAEATPGEGAKFFFTLRSAQEPFGTREEESSKRSV